MRRLAGKLVFPWRRQGRFLAVDYDSRQIRVVQAERSPGGGVKILKLAATELPEGTSAEDPQVMGGLLRQTIDRMRASRGPVLMCVPRGQSVLKPLVLPRAASVGELAGMVQYQAEKELTFRPSEAVVDFTLESHYGAEGPPEEAAEGEHVLVAAVRQPVVDFCRAMAKAAGLNLVALGMRPYANLRCVETYTRRSADARVAVVHITADESEIDIFYSGGVSFSRPAVIKVPPAGAEPDAGNAAQSVVTEVTRSLHSYLGVEREHKIDAVLVAGGTGIEPRVAAELHRRLGVTAETFDPGQALGVTEGGTSASAFVSALGLAVCYADGVGLPVDFLHPKEAPVLRDKRKLMVVGVAAGLAMLVGGVFLVGATKYWAAKSNLDSLKARYQKLEIDNKPVTVLVKRVDTVELWQKSGRDWLDQWAYLSGILPPCTETYLTGMNSTPDGTIVLKVKTTTPDVLDEMGECLTDGGYSFKPGQVGTQTDPYNYKYATIITVKVAPNMKVDLASLPEIARPENDGSGETFGRPPARTASSTIPARPVPTSTAPARPVATPTAAMPTRPTTSPAATMTSRLKGIFGGGTGGTGSGTTKGGGGKGGRGSGGFVVYGPPEGDRHE
jgi:Tfp pilus assembly PilM family ATPase